MRHPEFFIDAAREEDIPALVDLLGTLFSIEQDFKPDPERQKRGLSGVLVSSNACLKVARVTPGKVIAMCSGQLVYSTSEGSPSVWIEDMVVDQEWRARGVGRVVLQSVLDWATTRGATRAQLLADLDNHPALAYYQHLGWQETRLVARRLALQP